jgi:hypothetical protein
MLAAEVALVTTAQVK